MERKCLKGQRIMSAWLHPGACLGQCLMHQRGTMMLGCIPKEIHRQGIYSPAWALILSKCGSAFCKGLEKERNDRCNVV